MSLKEKTKNWVREEAEVMDTYDAHEDSVLYGYRLAIEMLRAIPDYGAYGGHVHEAADYLESLLLDEQRESSKSRGANGSRDVEEKQEVFKPSICTCHLRHGCSC